MVTQRAPAAPALAYYRVSTQHQGRSGLGLEAQREAVERFAVEREFLSPRAREEQCLPADPARSALARSLRTLRFVKTGPESSKIELANAGQLTVNRGLVFTMSLESLLDLRRPAIRCTRRPPRREQMACRFRLLEKASAVLHIRRCLAWSSS